MAFMFFFPLLLVAKVSSGFDCPEEWIDCGNGNCIADIYRCDGDNDCGNFRDEQNCDNLPPKKCQSSQFQCLESGHCILETWRCDGERDCEDGSDEHTCDNLPPKKCQSSQFQCLESGHCILETWRCDGERDCEDGSDEHTCAPKTCGSGKFQCKIGVCIDQVMVCDRRKDCEDGSDEMNCTQANATCKAGRYACRDGVGCIYEHEVCDGHKDCSRGEDETNCMNVSLDCTSEEYLCSNTSRCSPRRWICDGDDDCGDRSDKPTDCIDVVEPVIRYKDAITTQKCPDGDFSCSNGRCILSSSKCDGTDDCGDNSDEIGCPCEDYTCPVSGECISWSSVCDEKQNCADLMDEGPLCASSCEGVNGSCAHKCQKTPQGPMCSCHEGYALSEDGFSCYDECDTPGRCSHFCNRTNDGFKCLCAKGYIMETDQKTCKAASGESYLTYLLKDKIQGFNLETHSKRVYVSGNFASVIGVGYDAVERVFFLANRNEKTVDIYSADLVKFEVLLSTEQKPLLLRRDWMTKNIYYSTDQGSIVCCDGNGSHCTSVITNASSHITGFDISPAFAFIFFSVSRHDDVVSLSGVIERANMDGSSRVVIVSEGIFLLTAIAVDPVLEAIYWCDSALGVIESTDFNGFKRRKVVDHLQYPISLTVFEDYIYWAERTTNSLNRCDKFSGKDRETLLRETTPLNSLLVTHKAAQIQGENRCAGNNCLHICLPTRTSFICKCDYRNFTGSGNCERISSSIKLSCPEDYCPENFVCAVDDGHFVCKCPHFAGDKCKKTDGSAPNEPHPLWIVCGLLVVVCVCLLATLLIFFRRCRKSTEISIGTKVQYMNKTPFQGSCETAGKVVRRENEYEAVAII